MLLPCCGHVTLCRRLSDTVRISQAVKAGIAQTSALPFELKVLEALLAGEQGWGGTWGSVGLRQWGLGCSGMRQVPRLR